MGLDTVELVMRIEEEFSIDLPDWELSSVRTVGDLYALVLSNLDTTPACLTSKAFYRTRRAMMDALNLPRRSIRPSTSLDPLLPSESRIERWNEIGAAINLDFPRLRRRRRPEAWFLKVDFELPVQTAGELSRMVLTMNYSAFAPAPNGAQPLSREYVWERIVYIFADQLQIDPEDIVAAADIAVDLGVD
jgi:hypothetical protein